MEALKIHQNKPEIMTTKVKAPSSVESIAEERLSTYCARFENGWLDRLVEEWDVKYLAKYAPEISDPQHFFDKMRADIQWYWDYLMKRVQGDRFEMYDKAKWIRQKYAEILMDEPEVPKEPQNNREQQLVEWILSRLGIDRIVNWLFGKNKPKPLRNRRGFSES